MAKLLQVTPFVMVSNLKASIAFYQDVLVFQCTYQAYNYAYIRREGAALRLLQAEPECDLHNPLRQQSCYIDVDDLDGLYTDLKPALEKLPAGRVKAPFDTFYGQREFHVSDLDTLLILFGMPVAKPTDRG